MRGEIPQRPREVPGPRQGGLLGEATRAYMATQGGGGGGGGPQPPDLNAAARQVADQAAQQKVQDHEQHEPHLTEQRVTQIIAQQGLVTETRAREVAREETNTILGQHQYVERPDLQQAVTQEVQGQVGPAVTNQVPTAVDQAVQNKIGDIADEVRRRLPAGPGGQGASEQDIRTWANEQIAADKAANPPMDDARAGQIAEDKVTEKVTDGTLATAADLTALTTRVTAVEGKLPAGNDPLITETEVDTRIQTARQALEAQITQVQGNIPALPANIITADELNRRIPPPTAGQRLLAIFGDRRARRYVEYYDANAANVPAVVVNPNAPANPVVATNTIDRRNLLLGTGAALAGLGVCAWLGLPAVGDFIARIRGTEYYPPGSGGTTTIPPGEYTPTGHDYNNMSPQEAEQVLKFVNANYPQNNGPIIHTDIDSNSVGIATGWQVSYGGQSYTKGDTAAFKNHADVTISDGAWRVVPSTVARDAFVAVVVYTKALGQDMTHAQPLPEWNLPSYG